MKTIKTPSVFTIDPSRYHTTREVTPRQTPDGTTPGIEIGMDYALLAADLDVFGYPDELTEAILALDPDHGGKVAVSFKASDLVVTSEKPSASIFDPITQTWKPMDIEDTTDPDSEQQDGE